MNQIATVNQSIRTLLSILRSSNDKNIVILDEKVRLITQNSPTRPIERIRELDIAFNIDVDHLMEALALLCQSFNLGTHYEESIRGVVNRSPPTLKDRMVTCLRDIVSAANL